MPSGLLGGRDLGAYPVMQGNRPGKSTWSSPTILDPRSKILNLIQLSRREIPLVVDNILAFCYELPIEPVEPVPTGAANGVCLHADWGAMQCARDYIHRTFIHDHAFHQELYRRCACQFCDPLPDTQEILKFPAVWACQVRAPWFQARCAFKGAPCKNKKEVHSPHDWFNDFCDIGLGKIDDVANLFASRSFAPVDLKSEFVNLRNNFGNDF